ncbi:hypothetical protein JXE04_01855 [Patescibacteria group bacterium]|nr:hypothetical protein [Patescibacteria group bacterium]
MKARIREAVREDARRQHRVLGMYCALYCWHHQKEAIFVSKDLFLEFIGLERLKKVRFEWLQNDVNSYFPYVFIHKLSNSNSTEVFVLSRLSKSDLMANKKNAIHFKPAIFNLANNYSKEAGIEVLLGEKGSTTSSSSNSKILEANFPFIASIENMYEFSISSALSSLASGLICPEAALFEKQTE